MKFAEALHCEETNLLSTEKSCFTTSPLCEWCGCRMWDTWTRWQGSQPAAGISGLRQFFYFFGEIKLFLYCHTCLAQKSVSPINPTKKANEEEDGYYQSTYKLYGCSREVGKHLACLLSPVVSDLWSVICDLWSVICDLWSVICDLWSVIYHL